MRFVLAVLIVVVLVTYMLTPTIKTLKKFVNKEKERINDAYKDDED